jgi:hypothetical protein
MHIAKANGCDPALTALAQERRRQHRAGSSRMLLGSCRQALSDPTIRAILRASEIRPPPTQPVRARGRHIGAAGDELPAEAESIAA